MANTKLGFKKGNSFSSYVEGEIYFETSTHLIKVGLAGNTCEVYSGVRSASWDSTNKKLTIVNQAGTNIELDFADVASATGVNSLLATLRDDINKKLDAPTATGTAGQVLQLDSNGNTVWYSIPAATDYTVTMDSSTSGLDAGILKRYTIKQGASGSQTTIGTIDIPKDLVVTSGSVVTGSWSGNTFTEDSTQPGSGTGKAVKLTIANQTAPVYINVADLVDVYTAQQNATQVQLAISSSNEISATIVDGAVSTSKLDSSVQTALGKANSALQKSDITEGTGNGTIKVDGTDVSVHGLGSAAYMDATAIVQSITEGTGNGTINVDGTDVSVHGLGSAAYEASTAFATAAQGTKADSAIQSVSGQTAVADSSYVAISVEASTNSSTKAVTLTSHANVTTHDVSTAVVSSADGLALASDVKGYVDAQHEWLQFN
jgi:hypothetical protein